MEKAPPAPFGQRTKANSLLRVLSVLSLVAVGAYVSLFTVHLRFRGNASLSSIPINANEIQQKCRNLNVVPGPSPDFYSRSESDRFEHGTKSVLIKNATVWTGEKVIESGDVLLDKGIIKAIGNVDESQYDFADKINAYGAWLSPGIVDLHSHLGVASSPILKGASDVDSLKGITQPWLRSLDGLNTHDDTYLLSIAGGVTTAVVLPGSANSIGGQAFVIKLRSTIEKSPSSMLLEPPFSFNGSGIEPFDPPRWRQLKQACGEFPSEVYSQTRMDTIWSFRKAYSTAQSIKRSQDDFCSFALSNSWSSIGGSSATFPESPLEWEALVDVLRGRVKIQNHCYEAVDLDGIIRLTNEFKFKIAAFHHAHETYLVPDLLKKMYGGEPPAVALFATSARYKREAYRGSEFAPKVLAENGLNVVMKSDHPLMNSRYLLHEAQQAHYFGLEEELALKSVTVTPAKVMGMDHRIGYVKEGYDADLVLWDSHPLSLGATPKQVFIDGIPQLKSPHFISSKPAKVQTPPKTPNWDREAKEAVEWDGNQPLGPRERFDTGTGKDIVMFVNVESMYAKSQGRVFKVFGEEETNGKGVVLVKDGEAICQSVARRKCLQLVEKFKQEQEVKIKIVDLDGGSLAPGLVSYGSDLGLSHIAMESSTSDGPVLDPLSSDPPAILGDTVIRAVDGLVFESRNALLAYRSGVTSAITPPSSSGFLSGLSTVFSTGSSHALERGAVLKPVTALHVGISMNGEKSVATQVGVLRRMLLSGLKEETQAEEGELGAVVRKVLDGTLPLIISVDSADIMASLIRLKKEVEDSLGAGREIKVVFDRAAEAHLVAEQIGKAGIGVILSPVRAFPLTWEQMRILPGPPLSQDTAVTKLLKSNVTVALGTSHNWGWVAQSARFDAGWASLDSSGLTSDAQALELVSTTLERLLGVQEGGEGENTDWVATRGGSLLDFEAKVVGIVSSRRGVVDLF
ncbi:hypothetical protein VKT23_001629 [Stygiomarasmius scandens]|uniref:Amidohydrolase-related domain-containing protein n=1 Tax=Marasmiellus scandens TaxID=2682957 RepID=A0ABR1K5P3_9AGAR